MKKTKEEIDLLRLKFPNVPDFALPKTRNKKSSPANELTFQIISLIKSIGGSASRVNTQGNYNQKLKRFTFSGARKGAADISACIQGRNLQIEVKIKKDVQSPAQVKFQSEIEASGGTYIIAKDIDSFKEDLNKFLLKLK